jgi:multicomponent Na+:H+ antiporter subunit E
MIRTIVLLALAWVALTGDLSPGSLLFALVLGGLATAVAWPLGPYPLFRRVRPLKILTLLLYFAAQVVIANLKVAAAVLGPRSLLHPAVVAIPLDIEGDDQITLLANLITLTPGTLSLDVSDDRRTLFVHAMSASSPEDLRREIKEGFERRIREALP